MTWRRFGETQQIHSDHRGGSRPRRPQGRLKSTQRETLLKESHAAPSLPGQRGVRCEWLPVFFCIFLSACLSLAVCLRLPVSACLPCSLTPAWRFLAVSTTRTPSSLAQESSHATAAPAAGGSADSLAGAALLAGRGEDTVARAIREEVAERRAAMLSMAGTPR